jgi:hypothetical protein
LDKTGALATWKYKTERVTLLPYTQDTMPEALLPSFFHLLKKEGTSRFTFPEAQDLTLAEFMHQMYGKPLLLGVSSVEDKILGFGWLWDVKGQPEARIANVGFACFRDGWGKRLDPDAGRDIREIARLALGWWFCEAGVEVLYGAVLQKNRLAQKFAIEVGFKRLTTLPKFLLHDGKRADAALFCAERDVFMGGA